MSGLNRIGFLVIVGLGFSHPFFLFLEHLTCDGKRQEPEAHQEKPGTKQRMCKEEGQKVE